MKTKREVLEKFKECAMCEDIYCSECPYNKGFGERCDIERILIKLGAKIMLEDGDLEVEEC